MSRFSNPTRTGVYTLPGGCLCPGQPHETDWIELRLEASAADMATMFSNGTNVGVVRTLAVKWNLLDDDGKPAELTPRNVGLLFSDAFDDLDAWINENVQMAAVPKASGDQSSTGTPAKDRPNRAARRQRRSTRS